MRITHSFPQTALSQHYNLYFVAYADEVFVYQPQFPTQSLQTGTEFVLKLPVSAPNLRGYIDSNIPHCINHLIVGDLGNEEILLCACDDGDVIGYTTRSIHCDMERRGSEGLSTTSLTPAMRPFIFHNVGASAWGLAIHKEARMIAVSANTKQIIVFAFGLGRARSPESTTSSYHSEDIDLDTEISSFVDTPEGIRDDWNTNSESFPRDRSFNQILFLLGHKENIPDITFCNTTDDPTGRYLVSTDIAGVILIWDIWKRSGVKKYTPVLAEHESINYVYRT